MVGIRARASAGTHFSLLGPLSSSFTMLKTLILLRRGARKPKPKSWWPRVEARVSRPFSLPSGKLLASCDTPPAEHAHCQCLSSLWVPGPVQMRLRRTTDDGRRSGRDSEADARGWRAAPTVQLARLALALALVGGVYSKSPLASSAQRGPPSAIVRVLELEGRLGSRRALEAV